MRKLVFILVCCVHFTAVSQDVITTKTGESIRAKIIEVSDENVLYKRYNDQQGATFILKTEIIKRIAWENGDVDEYKEVVSEQELPILKESSVLPYISRKHGSFYLDNGQVYDEEQLRQFLVEKNLNHVWTRYASGKNLFTAGWAVIGGGAALYSVGIFTIFSNHGFNDDMGLPFMFIGGAALYAGIPLAIVGTVRKSRAINEYNAMYSGRPRNQYSQNISIKAGYTGNGLGFVLNF